MPDREWLERVVREALTKEALEYERESPSGFSSVTESEAKAVAENFHHWGMAVARVVAVAVVEELRACTDSEVADAVETYTRAKLPADGMYLAGLRTVRGIQAERASELGLTGERWDAR